MDFEWQVAPICHGPTVAAAGLVWERCVAGVDQVQTTVQIMGGRYDPGWYAVIDGRLVSGRVPVDVPEFLDTIIFGQLSDRELTKYQSIK